MEEKEVKSTREVIENPNECVEVSIADLKTFQVGDNDPEWVSDLTEEEMKLFAEGRGEINEYGNSAEVEGRISQQRAKMNTANLKINDEEREVLELATAPNFMAMLKEEFKNNPIDYRAAQDDPSWMF